jgi:nucleotide-binding universal stress UspA family protein
MYRSIVVPLDGSAFSEQVLPIAAILAKRAAAAVHIVTVSAPAPVPAAAVPEDWWLPGDRNWEEEFLTSAAARVSEGEQRPVVTALLSGPTALAIHHYAVEQSADLIIMATHGRSGLSRLWLGSVADRLVRHSTVPVLLVRPETDVQPRDEGSEPPFRHILIPLDGSPLAERIIGYATRLGTLVGASYTLVRVVQPTTPAPGTRATSDEDETEHRREARRYLAVMAERLQDAGHRVTRTSVLVDPVPATAIPGFARAVGADLIALATHGRGGLSRAILGSVADKLLRSSPVPVLLYRPEESY